MAADNVSLGSFNLTDLPPAPRGVPQIDVKFDIDANGILNVTATDLGTKKEAKITIEAGSKLSKDEIEKLKQDAEKFADEDKQKKESIDIKNEAESFIYTTEKLINGDLKDKIPQEKGIKISDAVKELKEVLNKDSEQIKSKLEALKSIVNEITTELYKNTTPPPGDGQQSSEGQQAGEGQQTNENQQAEGEQKSESTSEQDSTKGSSSN